MSGSATAVTALWLRNPRKILSSSSAEVARLLITFFFSLLIPLEVWSIARLLPVSKVSGHYLSLDALGVFEKILSLFYPLTILLFVLLITGWLWLPLLSRIGFKRSSGTRFPSRPGAGKELKRTGPCASLVLLVFSALLGVLVPVSQWSSDRIIGSTAPYYLGVLTHIEEGGIWAAFSTERPIFFVILYLTGKITSQEPFILLRDLPVALGAGLSVGTYLFVRLSGGSWRTAALVAIFSAFSPHVTVGLEYFIVANWLAMILMMAFYAVFLRSLRRRSVLWGALTVGISMLVLGIHYSSWLFMVFVILVYLLLALFGMRFPARKDAAWGIGLVFGCMFVVVPIVVLAPLVGEGFVENLHLAENMVQVFLTNANPSNFVAFLTNEGGLFQYLGKKHYAIPLSYALALLGFAGSHTSIGDWECLLKSWTISSCLGVLVVHYDELWRFLYMMPIEILAGMGLISIFQSISVFESKPENVEFRGEGAVKAVLCLAGFLMVGVLLALTSLLSLLFLGPCLVVVLEIFSPFKRGWSRTILLLVTFLALAEFCRALYALS